MVGTRRGRGRGGARAAAQSPVRGEPSKTPSPVRSPSPQSPAIASQARRLAAHRRAMSHRVRNSPQGARLYSISPRRLIPLSPV